MPRIPPETTNRARTLRNAATPAERLLWTKLRSYSPRFTRQLPIGTAIADLACREARLAIELDGGHHAHQTEADEIRTAQIESQGWQVLRFWNSEVLANSDDVTLAILAAVEARTGTHLQPLPSREWRTRTPRTRK